MLCRGTREPARGSFDLALGRGVGDTSYLEAIEELVPKAFAAARAELVFYLAGVDVAEDDRLGSWLISADAIVKRDLFVFERAGRVPIVMLTAGGYGSEAWRYTARTLAWLASGVDEPIRASVERSLARFRHIKETLEPIELGGQADPFALTEADLYGDLDGGFADTRILDYYTRYGIELAFERYGFLPQLRKRGYGRFVVETTPHTGLGDRIRVYSEDDHLLLMELVIRIANDIPPYKLLQIEWLLLQDPRAKPSPDRPLLPGQEHPGLGCLSIIVGMLVMACERLQLDGLLFTPAHYHVAAQARGVLRFFDANDEAFFVALGEITKPLPLARATAMVDEKRIVDERGEPVSWRASRMVFAVSDRLKEAIGGAAYERAVEAATAGYTLRVASAQ